MVLHLLEAADLALVTETQIRAYPHLDGLHSKQLATGGHLVGSKVAAGVAPGTRIKGTWIPGCTWRHLTLNRKAVLNAKADGKTLRLCCEG